MTSKRRRTVLTFRRKLELLQRLEGGESGRSLAEEYGIGTSTISDIRRNAHAILQFAEVAHLGEKKTRKTAQNTDLDSRVFRWYQEHRRAEGEKPPDSVVCAKALEINAQLRSAGTKNFKASPGWLRHFKQRHGIIGEAQEAPQEPARQVKTLIKRGGYTLENVYSVGEAFLEWKSLPETENKPNCVTVLFCTNANGSHRLVPLVVGPDPTVECSSPIYKYQKCSKMTSELFTDWFYNYFVPEVKMRQESTGNIRKILLLLEEVPWHSDYESLTQYTDLIEVFFLTGEICNLQPIEIGIKTSFKIAYRKQLLRKLQENATNQFLNEFNLYGSMSLIEEAWESIPKPVISQSWGQILSNPKQECNFDQDLEELVLVVRKTPGFDSCSRDSVIQWLESDKEASSSSFEMDFREEQVEESQNEGEGPTALEAYRAFETAIHWLRNQQECNESDLGVLEELRDMAERKMCSIVKTEVFE